MLQRAHHWTHTRLNVPARSLEIKLSRRFRVFPAGHALRYTHVPHARVHILHLLSLMRIVWRLSSASLRNNASVCEHNKWVICNHHKKDAVYVAHTIACVWRRRTNWDGRRTPDAHNRTRTARASAPKERYVASMNSNPAPLDGAIHSIICSRTVRKIGRAFWKAPHSINTANWTRLTVQKSLGSVQLFR